MTLQEATMEQLSAEVRRRGYTVRRLQSRMTPEMIAAFLEMYNQKPRHPSIAIMAERLGWYTEGLARWMHDNGYPPMKPHERRT